MAKRGASLFSVSTVLASFFGAAMIAGAFAYFNYKFSEYKFINFSEWVFYQESDLFVPDQERYLIIFYSSKIEGTAEKIAQADAAYPVLAIDYYQQSATSTENTTFLRAGTNTNLQFIQRFNIYKSPSIFLIKKSKETLYKQDSMIRELDTLDILSQTQKEL
ncbi:MAG: hypothetical protein U9Q62_12300 [Campylobacterota bacterium]|nr:hypothetical protein [Campylobacterota bacterium]